MVTPRDVGMTLLWLLILAVFVTIKVLEWRDGRRR
jgi:hypothetical protein